MSWPPPSTTSRGRVGPVAAGDQLSTADRLALDKAIRQGAGNLLVGLVPFDRYRGPGVPEGTRSLAFRLRLQAPDRTLTDADVATVVTAVTAAAGKLGAALRT